MPPVKKKAKTKKMTRKRQNKGSEEETQTRTLDDLDDKGYYALDMQNGLTYIGWGSIEEKFGNKTMGIADVVVTPTLHHLDYKGAFGSGLGGIYVCDVVSAYREIYRRALLGPDMERISEEGRSYLQEHCRPGLQRMVLTPDPDNHAVYAGVMMKWFLGRGILKK